MGTGLELDRLNDFEIIIDDFNDVANTIGLKKDYFETKINLLLNENGTSPNILPTTNFLFVQIKFIDIPSFSKIENQYLLNEVNSNEYVNIYYPDVKKNKKNGWQGRLCWDTPFICSYNKLEVGKNNGYLIINRLKN